MTDCKCCTNRKDKYWLMFRSGEQVGLYASTILNFIFLKSVTSNWCQSSSWAHSHLQNYLKSFKFLTQSDLIIWLESIDLCDNIILKHYSIKQRCPKSIYKVCYQSSFPGSSFIKLTYAQICAYFMHRNKFSHCVVCII